MKAKKLILNILASVGMVLLVLPMFLAIKLPILLHMAYSLIGHIILTLIKLQEKLLLKLGQF